MFGWPKEATKVSPLLTRIGSAVSVILLLIQLGSFPVLAAPLFTTQTNSTPLEIDNTVLDSTVIMPAGIITDVNISITFEKISDSSSPACIPLGGSGHDGNSPYNTEISFSLESPLGTVVDLVLDQSTTATYTSSTAYGGVNTVIFDDAATFQVGGSFPITAVLQPEEPLSTFNGEAAAGTWILHAGDNSGADPLCLYEWTLAVNETLAFGGGGGTTSSGDKADEAPRCALKEIPTKIYIGPAITFTASGTGRLEALRFRNVDSGGFSWLVPSSVSRSGNSWEATFSNANLFGMTAIEPGVYQVICFGPGGTSGEAIKVTVVR